MTSETLYKACNEYFRINMRKYSDLEMQNGEEIKLFWNEEKWHNLNKCKADFREVTVLSMDSETGEVIYNRAILLRSYSTIIAVAFIPMTYMHDVNTCAIVRFGTFSATSSQHFWKFVQAITERNGYTRVCLYYPYDSYDSISMAILDTNRRYPTWQYIIQKREAKSKHLLDNDYERMINAAITCIRNNYVGRRLYI